MTVNSTVLVESGKKAMDIQELKSSQQQQTAMQFLQQEQQQQQQLVHCQQLQMQLYGQTSPCNVGLADRIPETNFILQAGYQQGGANVQLLCFQDKYAPCLGHNGRKLRSWCWKLASFVDCESNCLINTIKTLQLNRTSSNLDFCKLVIE